MRKKNVKDFYNKTAKQWADRFYASIGHLPVLIDFMSRLPYGSYVLDLCCGAGYDSLRLAQMGATVVGIDISEESISIARKRNPDISFHICDMLNDYSFIGKVDAIVCLAGLVHIPAEKLRIAFERMFQVMDSDGVMLLRVYDGEGRVDRMSEYVIDGEEYDRSFYAHTLEELNKYANGLFVFERVIVDSKESIWVNYVFKRL